jgi:hypothetical protein
MCEAISRPGAGGIWGSVQGTIPASFLLMKVALMWSKQVLEFLKEMAADSPFFAQFLLKREPQSD